MGERGGGGGGGRWLKPWPLKGKGRVILTGSEVKNGSLTGSEGYSNGKRQD